MFLPVIQQPYRLLNNRLQYFIDNNDVEMAIPR